MRKIILFVLLVFISLTVEAQWTQQVSGTTFDLYSVCFTSIDTGYVVGNYGKILKTTDGGVNWVSQTSGTPNALFSVCFPSVDTGYAVGYSNMILKTTNGGTTWVSQLLSGYNFYSSVYFINTSIGYVVGATNGNSGIISKTIDGGNTWTTYYAGGLWFNSVYFPNANTGYAVGYGYGQSLQTTNGGTSWVYNGGGAGKSVFFPSSATGFIVNGSAIRKTINTGTTWTTQASSISQTLISVYFVDVDTGYVVGNNGTIYKTYNGGAFWNPQSCPVTTNLNSVFFPNKTTGYAVGVGGKILKTANGGYPTPFCTPPTITANPTYSWDTVGATGTFSISTLGSPPFTYNWYTNGVLSSSITSNSLTNLYTTPILTSLDSGNTYYCIVTNCGGISSDTSTSAILNITQPCTAASIIHQPISQTGAVGGTISFGIKVNGTPPFTYRWYRGAALVSTTVNSNSDTSYYTTPILSHLDNGASFHCVVSNCFAMDTTGNGYPLVSTNAILTVPCPTIPTPIATASPSLLCGSTSVSLYASSIPGATYSWSGSGVTNPSAQNTSAILSFPVGAYMYSVVATVNGCSSLPGIVTVGVESSQIAAPPNQTICSGGTVVYFPAITGNCSSNPPNLIYVSHSAPFSVTGFASPNYTNSITDVLINSGTTPATVTYYITPLTCCVYPSNVSFNVIVNPSPTINVTSSSICTGQTATLTASGANSFTWSNGATSTGTNTANASPLTTHTYTVTGSIGNCSSTSTASVFVNPVYSSNVTASICQGATYTFPDGTIGSIATTHTSHLSTIHSCDSAIVTTLVVNSPSTSTINAATCNSYTLNSQTYTASGTYYQTLINSNGCDSIVTLNLVVNNSSTSTINAATCDSYTLNAQTYATSGTYNQTLTNINGCDSIVTLYLLVNNPSTSTINIAACYSYTLDSQTYSTSGTYSQTLTNSNGCDSLITLNLTISPPAPSQPSSILGITHVCDGSSTAYGVINDSAATSYTWSLPPTWSGSSDSCLITATADSLGGVITVIASNGCGSSTPQSINVYGSARPVVTLSPLGTVCENLVPFPLTNGNPPGGTYSGIGENSNIFYPYVAGVGTYYITYTYISGACTVSDSVPITVDLCLNVTSNTEESNGITISPNPFTSETTITFNKEQLNTNIKVIDVTGREIKNLEQTLHNTTHVTLDMRGYAKGVYIVQMTDDNKNTTNKKVIIE